MSVPVLSVCIFLPLAAALLILIGGTSAERWGRPLALAACSASLAISVWVTIAYAADGTTFVERVSWFPQIGVEYYVGIDGLSVYMLLLATWVAVMALWLSPHDVPRPRLYYALVLILAAGTFGVFCALDLLLFYVFWETVFIPIYFLITIWGEEGASAAATKFLVFMIVGSLVMLLGVVGVYFAGDPRTFDLAALAEMTLDTSFQRLAFAAFFVGFAVKVPLFPFHVWLPDAYTAAPTPITAIMSASLAAMGAYGFWRVSMAVLPDAFRDYAWLVALLATFSVVYFDICATAQRDLKRMTAYASASHMGLVMLGATAANILGVRGSVMQTFNHGLAMAALFFVVEDLDELAGTRNVLHVSRLMAAAPLLAGAVWLTMLASFGMPGLATFPGELTIILGTFQRYPVFGLIAIAAMIITAGYIFWVLSKMTLGVKTRPLPAVEHDLSGRDLAASGVFGFLLIAFGVAPILISGPIQSSVEALVSRVGMP
jgi:NADH-quinone oxidoreductase subunit M